MFPHRNLLTSFSLNPALPNGNICSRLGKISIQEKGIVEKISYERCTYGSVDNRSLFGGKNVSGSNGLS